MTIIRGATTIACDSKEEISVAVKELLSEIFTANTLRKEEVKGFLFSSRSKSFLIFFTSKSIFGLHL